VLSHYFSRVRDRTTWAMHSTVLVCSMGRASERKCQLIWPALVKRGAGAPRSRAQSRVLLGKGPHRMGNATRVEGKKS
jgi:hypothetical protein